MPPPSQKPTPLGPQIGIETVDLGSNDPPFSLTLQQLTARCTLIQTAASPQYEEARPWLEQNASLLLPAELHETIGGFPPLAAKASLVVVALPPERQIEFLRGLLPPATVSAAAAKPDVDTIASLAHAIVEGGSSDPALRATLANELMTEEACMTLAAEGTVAQLANAVRALSLQADAATKEGLMRALLIPARPALEPQQAVSNAYLVEGAMMITDTEDRSVLVDRYLSDETCDEVAERGGHIEIGSMTLGASFLQDPERLNEVADRLLTDRALDTLVNAAMSGLPRSHQAIGRAAKLVDALPDGDLQTQLADRLVTPEVCNAVEASGNPRAIGRMAMAAMSVSNIRQFTAAMEALASRAVCDTLLAHPEPLAISQLLYTAAYWNKHDGTKGLTAADMLLQGAPLEALCNRAKPRDAMNALPAVTMLPDPERRHATLTQLLHPEMIAAVSENEGDLIAWTAFYAPHMKDGPDRDTALRGLLTPSNCEKVLTFGDEEIQAFRDAAALLPESAQRQQVLAIMNGQQPKQWALLAAGQRTPRQRPRGAAAGADL